jgi:hypothetical protein
MESLRFRPDPSARRRRIDRILNDAKDAIAESEVMGCPPDEATATMAGLLAASVRHIDAGVVACMRCSRRS